MAEQTFTVLAVCSGNVARSPLMQALLTTRVDAPGLEFASAGTIATTGEPMTDEAVVVARAHGALETAHRSQPLTEELVTAAGLILTATREHRADVVRLVPVASRYTFTLREFARLAASLDAETLHDLPREYPERGSELVRAVAARRGTLLPLTTPTDDDVDDPFLRPLAIYERVGAEISDALGVVVSVLSIPEPERED